MSDLCVVSVTHVGMRGFAYYQPALYYPAPRVRDGAVTCRRKCVLLTPYRSYSRACRDAENYAADNGLFVDFDIKRGMRVTKQVFKRLAELYEGDAGTGADVDAGTDREGGVE